MNVNIRSPRWILFLACFLAICLNFLHAQELYAHSSEQPVPNQQNDQTANASNHRFIVYHVWDDFRYLVTQPDFYFVVGGLGITPEAFKAPLKHESIEVTEDWGPSKFADAFFEGGEVIGDGIFPVAVSAASWGVGKLTGSLRLSKFGSDLIRAQAMNGLFTVALKVAINRPRPSGANYSYPSGHTSSAFTTAGVIYSDFGPAAGIPAFALAGYVGLSRLQEGKHYMSDVIAGAILGSYISLKLAQKDKSQSHISVSPLAANFGPGISLRYQF